MPGNEREFRIRIAAAGSEEAKAQLEALRAAQEALNESVKGGKKPAEDQNDEKKKSVELGSEFLAVLNRINPALGGLAQLAIDSARGFEKLGGGTKDIGELFSAAGKAAGNFQGTLLTLGAAGAAAGAILFLVETIRKMREELEKATEAQREFNRLQGEQAGERQGRREDITQAAIAANQNISIDKIERASQLLEQVNLAGLVASDAAAGIIGKNLDAINSLDREKIELLVILGQQGITAGASDVPQFLLDQAGGIRSTLINERSRIQDLASQGREPFIQSELTRRGVSSSRAEEIIDSLANGNADFDQYLGGLFEAVRSRSDYEGRAVDRQGKLPQGQSSQQPGESRAIALLADALGLSPFETSAFVATLRGGGGVTVNVNNPRYQGAGTPRSRTGASDGASREY